jgi:hypothetical protein
VPSLVCSVRLVDRAKSQSKSATRSTSKATDRSVRSTLATLKTAGESRALHGQFFWRPCGTWFLFFCLPRAYALGCILPPLRGWGWWFAPLYPQGLKPHSKACLQRRPEGLLHPSFALPTIQLTRWCRLCGRLNVVLPGLCLSSSGAVRIKATSTSRTALKASMVPAQRRRTLYRTFTLVFGFSHGVPIPARMRPSVPAVHVRSRAYSLPVRV